MITVLYGLLAIIDSIIYGLASVLFSVIYAVATTSFFKVEQINDIANKIYIVIGVVMLFKMVLSGIQYLVNPDVFEDKEKGLAGLLKKTVISIVLIVVTPAIFQFLTDIQAPIVQSLPKIILGANSTGYTDEESIGFNVSFNVLSSFVRLREEGPNATKVDSDGMKPGVGKGLEIHDFGSFVANVHDDCPGFTIFGLGGDMNNCQYDYMIIVSTISGGFLCYMLLGMVLDIAIRTIKFSVIQILAPIPISSYVFSKDRLNKFVKTASTVYLDLFIRMAVVYFIIFAIREMLVNNGLVNSLLLNISGSGPANTGLWYLNPVINIVLIFGLLMFAKNAPKFISELLGLPDIGSGEMADMFKPAWQRAGGAAGALLNPTANAVANWRQTRDIYGRKGHKLEALRRAAAGFGKGALDSVQGIMAGDDFSKQRQRHDAAKLKSLERAKRKQNRDRNRQEGKRRLDDLLERARTIKEKLLFKYDQELRNEAMQRLTEKQDRLKKMGAAINRAIANGSLTGVKLENALKEYNRLQNEIADPEKFLDNEVFKIKAERDQQKVITEHRDVITAKNNRISEIDALLADTSISEERRAGLISEKLGCISDIQQEEAAIENITHEKAMAQQKTELAEASAALADIPSKIEGKAAAEQRIKSAKTRIAIIDEQLADTSLSADEIAALNTEKLTLSNQNAEDEQLITTLSEEINKKSELEQKVSNAQKEIRNIFAKQKEFVQSKVEEYYTLEKDLVNIEGKNDPNKKDSAVKDKDGRFIGYEGGLAAEVYKQQQMVEEGIRQSGWRSSVDSYLGGIPVSGKGYTELSNLLATTRSNIYTGEAMTKLRQNADILVDENGNDFKFKTKFASKELSYKDVADLKAKMEGGSLRDDELRAFGIASVGMLKSAFEDIEKKAAAAYLTANVEEIINPDHKVVSEFLADGKTPNPDFVDTKIGEHRVRLKRHEINSAVEEWWNTFEDQLVKSGVPGAKIGELKAQFRRNPGDFMAKGSTTKDTYSIVGKKIIDSAKPDDGKK